MKRPEALLSFALPGLGQLAQKRFFVSGFFFFLFAALIAWSRYAWLLPMLALIAGAETLRVPSMPVSDVKLRRAYGAVGALGLLCWVVYAVSALSPLGAQARLQHDVETIRREYLACKRSGLQSDNAVWVCLDSRMGDEVDPGGTSYELSVAEGYFVIRSNGPDKVAGTADDLFFRTFLGDAR